jgi:hypothetical protein
MDQNTWNKHVVDNAKADLFSEASRTAKPVEFVEGTPREKEDRKLINPRMLEVGYRKEKANPYAMKAYRAFVGRPMRKLFRTATDAQNYAARAFGRWCRLYDAALVAMTSTSPAATEEVQVVTE